MGRSEVAAGALNVSSTLVWRLQGLTSGLVECRIGRTGSSLYSLSLRRRMDSLVDEIYPDEASAMARARQIRGLLVDSGSWIEVPDTALHWSC